MFRRKDEKLERLNKLQASLDFLVSSLDALARESKARFDVLEARIAEVKAIQEKRQRVGLKPEAELMGTHPF